MFKFPRISSPHRQRGWIGGALAVGGALLSSSASSSAASTQANATSSAAASTLELGREQIAAQQQATAQERADLAPWRTAGQGGLTLMQQLLGIDPGPSQSAAAAPATAPAAATQGATGGGGGYTWRGQTFPDYMSLQQAIQSYVQDQGAEGSDANNRVQAEMGNVQSTPGAAPAAATTTAPAAATTGTAATPGTATMSPSDIIKLDPGYQFRLNQGEQAVTQSAGVRLGPGLGGSTLKDLLAYGQDYASGEFQNIFSRASTLSGAGLGAATGQANYTQAGQTNQANIATTAGTNAANLTTSGAAATAAGTVGSANAFTSGVNNYMQQQTLKQILAGGSTGGGTSYSIPYDQMAG